MFWKLFTNFSKTWILKVFMIFKTMKKENEQKEKRRKTRGDVLEDFAKQMNRKLTWAIPLTEVLLRGMCTMYRMNSIWCLKCQIGISYTMSVEFRTRAWNIKASKLNSFSFLGIWGLGPNPFNLEIVLSPLRIIKEQL